MILRWGGYPGLASESSAITRVIKMKKPGKRGRQRRCDGGTRGGSDTKTDMEMEEGYEPRDVAAWKLERGRQRLPS